MDLRTNGLLSIDNSKEIDRIENDVIEEYNSFIGEFIKINFLSDTSLFLTASCRNTIVSKTHDIFCRIALLEKNLTHGKYPDLVKVDNKFVAKAIKQVLSAHKCNNVKISHDNTRNIFVLILLNFVTIFYIALNSWLWTRFNCKVRPKDKVLLVDTFLFKNSIDSSGFYKDRYYSNHEAYLTEQQLSGLYFAPTLFGLKNPWNYISLFRRIKLSDRNFLIKESWLKLSDYLFSLYFSIIIPLRVKKYPYFRGIDVSHIIRREVLSDIASPSLFRALCQYRFIRRLSKETVHICGVVNWFENSVNDRAFNLSFKKYYPNTYVKGYQGFMPIRYYASLQPQSYELMASVLPNELYVVNDDIRTLYKKTCKDLPLKLSPAFRFTHLFDLNDKRSDSDKIVLISLPGAGMDNNSIGMIQNYLLIADSLGKRVRVIVKIHPTSKKDHLMKLAPEFSDPRLEYTSKGIAELLESAYVLISSASSVCVEAISVGIPVAIYGNRSGVTMNPIPKTVPVCNWCVFYSEDQLKNFLKKALIKDERKTIVTKLFMPVGKENTRELFRCI